MKSVFRKYLFAVLALVALSACGGGVIPQNETPPADSSNWSDMQWEQDNGS